MIRGVHIARYRGIRELAADGFGRVNLVIGRNDCGKTAFLEALQLADDAEDAAHRMLVAQRSRLRRTVRSHDFERFWRPIFFDLHAELGLSIWIVRQDGARQALEVRQTSVSDAIISDRGGQRDMWLSSRFSGWILANDSNLSEAHRLASEALAVLGATSPVIHGVLTGAPRLGAFLTPDGASPGAIETLCRRAVRDPRLAACVDQLVGCAGKPHAAHGNSHAAEDKGWLRAYLGMMLEPDLRFHQAFEHPQGIDPTHAAFASLRAFVLSL